MAKFLLQWPNDHYQTTGTYFPPASGHQLVGDAAETLGVDKNRRDKQGTQHQPGYQHSRRKSRHTQLEVLPEIRAGDIREERGSRKSRGEIREVKRKRIDTVTFAAIGVGFAFTDRR